MEDVDEIPYETNPSDLLFLRKIVEDAPQLNRLCHHKETRTSSSNKLAAHRDIHKHLSRHHQHCLCRKVNQGFQRRSILVPINWKARTIQDAVVACL